MQDVRIKPNEYGLFDLVIDGADFESVDGLETSIAVSLFSDDRADESRVQNPKRRRGWIGNIFRASVGESLGSQLWTLEQARLTQDTINDARVFALESLQWLIDDGVAKSVNVDVSRSARTATISIELTTRSGEVRRYDYLWRNTSVSNISNS